jgi:hypothetical protein
VKKAVYFLLGSGAALVFRTPLKKLAREAAIGAVRAGRGMGRAMEGIKEDLEDVEAEARTREEARSSRRPVNDDTSVS